MKMIITGDHFAAKGKEMFKNKNSYSKNFFCKFFFVQNVYHPEKAYTSASKLLLLFATKYPKKTVTENGSFVQ